MTVDMRDAVELKIGDAARCDARDLRSALGFCVGLVEGDSKNENYWNAALVQARKALG